MHRASFVIVADHPVATPKDGGQAATCPEVRVLVAASSVIERTSSDPSRVRARCNDSIDVE
jgi:hypothetical protein